MDEGKTRQHVQEHAEAVARGDLDAAVADLSEERDRKHRRPRRSCCRCR